MALRGKSFRSFRNPTELNQSQLLHTVCTEDKCFTRTLKTPVDLIMINYICVLLCVCIKYHASSQHH